MAAATNRNWQSPPHILAIDRACCAAVSAARDRGDTQFLAIEAPPRHGKTLYLQHLLAWHLAWYPSCHVAYVSYQDEFSSRTGRAVRALMREHLLDPFGLSFRDDVQRMDEVEIAGHGGTLKTTGIGGALMGRGVHLLVIDDAIKNSEEALSKTVRDKHWDWFHTVAGTRLEPGAVVILCAQRWHNDDLTGRALSAAASGDGWPVTRLRFPALAERNDPLGRAEGDALWPQRISQTLLERRRRATPEIWWNAQYQQDPRELESRHWAPVLEPEFVIAKKWPEEFEWRAIGVDPSLGRDAHRGDFSAIVFIGVSGDKLYCRCDIRRLSPTNLLDAICNMMAATGAGHVAIETNQFQALLPNLFRERVRLRGLAMPEIMEAHHKTPKVARVLNLDTYFQGREILFRDDQMTRLMLEQLREFPSSATNDDGPDALEMAVWAIAEQQRRQGATGRTDELGEWDPMYEVTHAGAY